MTRNEQFAQDRKRLIAAINASGDKMRNVPVRVWNSLAARVLVLSILALPFALMAQLDYSAYVARMQETEGVGAMEARDIFWSDYFGSLLSEQSLQHFASNLATMISVLSAAFVLFLIILTIIALTAQTDEDLAETDTSIVWGLKPARGAVFFVTMALSVLLLPTFGAVIISVVVYLIFRGRDNPINVRVDRFAERVRFPS